MEESGVGESAGELRPTDWDALERLRARGDDLSDPRLTNVFFCKRKDVASPSAAFDVLIAAAEISGLTPYERSESRLVLRGDLYVHPQALEFLIEWAERWAEQAEVLFDGWECAVVTKAPLVAAQPATSALDA